LIIRWIIPVIWQPIPDVKELGFFGLGDMQPTFFLSPKKPAFGKLIWGVGPALQIPTAARPGKCAFNLRCSSRPDGTERKCGVRGAEFGVRSVECGEEVRSSECAECGVRSAGHRIAERRARAAAC